MTTTAAIAFGFGQPWPACWPALAKRPTRSYWPKALAAALEVLCGLAEGVIWPSVLAIVLIVLGIRMFLEIRACHAALATLSLAAAAFLAAAAVDLGWVVSLSDQAKPLVARGCWLAGYVFILATFLMVARHVLLEIEGVIVRPHKPKRHKAKHPPASQSDAVPDAGSALQDRFGTSSAVIERRKLVLPIAIGHEQTAGYEFKRSDGPRRVARRAPTAAQRGECVVAIRSRHAAPRRVQPARISHRANRPRGRSGTKNCRPRPTDLRTDSAAKYPLRTAPSIVAGQCVAVQSPATSRPSIAVC